MTPEEFTVKLEELRTIFADKLVELEAEVGQRRRERRDGESARRAQRSN
jgi:hypothetical protein